MDRKIELLVQLGFDLGKDFAVLSGLFPSVFAAFPTLGAVVLIFLLSGPQIVFYAVYRGLAVLHRQFAFPYGDDGPGERVEHLGALQVPFNVAGHLRLPEFHVRLRHDVLRASLVSVPEAAVDEDDGPVLRQHEIGRAGQPAVVEPVSITLAPQSVTHDLLRLRVAGADVGHTVVPLGGCHRIGHNLQEPEVIAANGGGNNSTGEVRGDLIVLHVQLMD